MQELSEEYLKLKEKVNNKRNLINKHSKELNKLLMGCKHEETKVEEYYFEGSYLDKAYTEYTLKCTLCGEVLSTSTKMHDYFG